jgi:2-aminoadipate transaminase
VMLEHAVKRGVAYVPGAAFYAEGPDTTRLRLSFASASAEQIAEGVRRLGDCIRDEFERAAQRRI